MRKAIILSHVRKLYLVRKAWQSAMHRCSDSEEYNFLPNRKRHLGSSSSGYFCSLYFSYSTQLTSLGLCDCTSTQILNGVPGTSTCSAIGGWCLPQGFRGASSPLLMGRVILAGPQTDRVSACETSEISIGRV